MGVVVHNIRWNMLGLSPILGTLGILVDRHNMVKNKNKMKIFITKRDRVVGILHGADSN